MNKKEMTDRIESLELKLDECEKSLKQSESLYNSNSTTLTKCNNEISDLHGLFDSMDGVIPQRNEQTYATHSLSARFASFLQTLINSSNSSHD